MKILVFSDSHGQTAAMLRAVAAEAPELILHLGDHDSDCAPLQKNFPGIRIEQVRGNCDPGSDLPEVRQITCGLLKIFMTHGHRYQVKMGDELAVNTAICAGADVLLYGHTHAAAAYVRHGLQVMNPGSIGYGRGTYGVIEIFDGEAALCLRESTIF